MVRKVKEGLAPPSFSYQAILLSREEAERTSRSPSPSRSAHVTDAAPSAAVLMLRGAKEGSAAPSFSYQATLSSRKDADRTSRSPSPSTSAAVTEVAKLTVVLMVRSVKEGSA